MTASRSFCANNGFGHALISLAIAAGLSAPLHAQSSNLSGAVALSSQLVDRGMALTPDTPILQGSASWSSSSGWALGLSAATEVRSPGHLSEALAQVAHDWSLSSDWRMQAGLLYYSYPGNAYASAFDRTETSVDWMYRDVLTFGLSAIVLTRGSDHQPRGAADLDFHWPLPRDFSLSAGAGVAQPLTGPYSVYGSYAYGYHYVRTSSYYGYGHAGLVWAHGPWRVELDRVAVDPNSRPQWGGLVAAPWVGTISRSF